MWVKPVTPWDISIVNLDTAEGNNTEPSSLRLQLQNLVDGLAIAVVEYVYNATANVTRVVGGLDATVWHQLLVVGSFDGRFQDKWAFYINNTYLGTYGAYYADANDYASTSTAPVPYRQTGRVRWSTDSAAVGYHGFYFDDFAMSSWLSTSPASPVAAVQASFEPATVLPDAVVFTMPNVSPATQPYWYGIVNASTSNVSVAQYFALDNATPPNVILTQAANISGVVPGQIVVHLLAAGPSGNAPFTLYVDAVDPGAPLNITSNATVTVTNPTVGQVVYNATASSLNGRRAELVFSISQGNASLFTVNSTSGVITLPSITVDALVPQLTFLLTVTDLAFQVLVQQSQWVTLQVGVGRATRTPNL